MFETRSTIHLSGWKDMPQVDSHCARLSRSRCSGEQSSGVCIFRYTTCSHLQILLSLMLPRQEGR